MNTTKHSEYSSVLPQGLKRFFRNRLKEIIGIAIILFSLSIMISIWFYNSNDPVFYFNSSSVNILNKLGIYGAYSSGLILHLLGIVSVPTCLCGIFWGLRLLMHDKINSPSVRLIGILPSCAALSICVSGLPINFNFLPQGPGGFIGMLGYSQFPILQDGWAYGYFSGGQWPFSLLIAFIALPLYLWSSAASKREMNIVQSVLKVSIIPLYKGLSYMLEKVFTKILNKEISNKAKKPFYHKRREPVIVNSNKLKKPKTIRQSNLDLENSVGYKLPSLELLKPIVPGSNGPTTEVLDSNSRMLESVLDDFGIRGDIATALTGPVVTRYDLNPSPGTKTSRVVSLADDIARSMSAISVRVAVVPGQNVIGIELPNPERETVLLREVLESDEWIDNKCNLPVALGRDIAGLPVVKDLSAMPHLLVAGTTGSGKSVAVNGMILSILYTHTPETCRLILVDPKMLELSVYDGIPHLLTPVVTEPPKAVMALKWAVREMEERYKSMSKLGVRNIAGYNKRLALAKVSGEILSHRVQTGFDPETGKPIYEEQSINLTPLPLIVVVIDEVADLMLVAGKDIEAAVQRLAQMARAAGIHVIMATQRPSVDVITGTIKANFPTRISFQVSSKIDSRTILGEQGGEQLLGKGDMLYMEGGGRITRIHGPFVSDNEVEGVVNYLKQQGDPEYDEEIVIEREDSTENISTSYETGERNELYDQAVALVARERKASTSFIQRHLKIGYNRAATIIEKMESEGVVSKSNHVGKREVLIDDHSSA